MAIYLVSYDLNRRKDYTKLINRIQQYKAHGQVLYSQWLIQSDDDATAVATDLLRYIDNDDGLLVSEMTQPGVAWRTLMMTDDSMRKWYAAARRC